MNGRLCSPKTLATTVKLALPAQPEASLTVVTVLPLELAQCGSAARLIRASAEKSMLLSRLVTGSSKSTSTLSETEVLLLMPGSVARSSSGASSADGVVMRTPLGDGRSSATCTSTSSKTPLHTDHCTWSKLPQSRTAPLATAACHGSEPD